MAQSLAPLHLPCLQFKSLPPCRAQYRLSMAYRLSVFSSTNSKHCLWANKAMGSGQFRMDMNNSSLPIPRAPTTYSFSWIRWILGSIVWLAVPSWKKVHSIHDVIKKMDSIVETVEDLAEATEKVASDVAEDLPDGDLKKLMLAIEQASEVVQKNAQLIDTVLDKVEELEEKITDTVEEAVPNQEKNKEGETK